MAEGITIQSSSKLIAESSVYNVFALFASVFLSDKRNILKTAPVHSAANPTWADSNQFFWLVLSFGIVPPKSLAINLNRKSSRLWMLASQAKYVDIQHIK